MTDEFNHTRTPPHTGMIGSLTLSQSRKRERSSHKSVLLVKSVNEIETDTVVDMADPVPARLTTNPQPARVAIPDAKIAPPESPIAWTNVEAAVMFNEHAVAARG